VTWVRSEDHGYIKECDHSPFLHMLKTISLSIIVHELPFCEKISGVYKVEHNLSMSGESKGERLLLHGYWDQ
jgi:hypothetical protein